MGELNASPKLGPSTFEYRGQNVTAYRWLGGGRGDDYVQVMFYHESERVVVYGGYAHKEFAPGQSFASKVGVASKVGFLPQKIFSELDGALLSSEKASTFVEYTRRVRYTMS